MADTINVDTVQEVRYKREATLQAGDVLSVVYNGTTISSFTVPTGKTVDATLLLLGKVH